MLEIDNIILRLKYHFGIKKNFELAEKIGVKGRTVDTWVNRKKIPEKILYEIANKENISYEWLTTGKGNKELPFLGQGADEILDANAAEVKVILPSLAGVSPRAYWRVKTDNNMYPAIDSGEYVIVDDIKEIKDGGIYHIEVGDDTYILRLHIYDDGRQVFKPDVENMAEEIPFNKQVKILGQVVYILKNAIPEKDY
ncbi:MAG: helix-turn-helix domain-containing protein [Campylobacteraceae bacterium]|jgi:SOS-response transcriptional repressor LexA|nr:helix-turn-helix domain-containing protein [Campylobacteraceae bacterium]